MTGPETDDDVSAPAEADDDAEPETATDQQALEDQATQLEDDLDSVDAALKRLDDGTYATCESCGETLSDEQLVADPTRRTCINGCASR